MNRISPLLSAFLAVSLVLSPVLTWYAYADESQEVEANEQSQDDGAAGSGDSADAAAGGGKQTSSGKEVGEGPGEETTGGEASGNTDSSNAVPAGSSLDGATEDAHNPDVRESTITLNNELGDNSVSATKQLDWTFVTDNSGTSNTNFGGNEETITNIQTKSATAIQTVINAALSNIGNNVGQSIWNEITGTSATDLNKLSFLMIADTRYLVDGIKQWMPTLNTRLLDIYAHSREIDTKLGDTNKLLGYINQSIGTVDSSISTFSSMVSKGISNLRSDISDLNVREKNIYDLLFSSYTNLNSSLGKIDASIATNGSLMSKGMSNLQESIATVDGHIYNGATNINTSLSTVHESIVTFSSLVSTAVSHLREDNNNERLSLATIDEHIVTFSSLVSSAFNHQQISLGTIDDHVVTFSTHVVSAFSNVLESLYTMDLHNAQHSALVSKGFSDVLEILEGLSFELVVSIDNAGVENRLDAIKNLLMLAGAKDLLDGLVGDFDLIQTGLGQAAVADAMQNAFPFCIPALFKQVLGLLQADPSPPRFEFDVQGAPLVIDFAPYGGFADMVSWLCRIGFTVLLLAVTPRFVYMGGVKSDA